MLYCLEYVIDSSPSSLLIFRGVGYSVTILFLTLLQIIPKVIYRFVDEEAIEETNSVAMTSVTQMSMAISQSRRISTITTQTHRSIVSVDRRTSNAHRN